MISQSNEGFITKVLRYWFRYVNSCLNIIHVITKLVKFKVLYLNRVLISYILSSDSNSNTKDEHPVFSFANLTCSEESNSC